jgi:hypothetical protein
MLVPERKGFAGWLEARFNGWDGAIAVVVVVVVVVVVEDRTVAAWEGPFLRG